MQVLLFGTGKPAKRDRGFLIWDGGFLKIPRPTPRKDVIDD